MSKFQILDAPVALPMKCSGCGLDHNMDGTVKFIDTGNDIDWYGTVYFCTNCFNEIAEQLGFLSQEKWDMLKQTAELVADSNNEIMVENDKLRSSLQLLSAHRCSPIGTLIVASPKERPEPQFHDEPLPLGDGESSDSDKSSPDEGLSDVRGDAKPNAKSKRVRTEPSVLSDIGF